MRTFRPASLLVVLVLLGVLACGLPAIPLTDQNSVSTIVAQTMAVILQKTQQANPGDPLTSTAATSTSTALPQLPTSTPTSTWTPLPTLTFTPTVPMLTVSVPTNCREGPGKLYDMVGALLVGEAAQVYGRDPTGHYWYIRNLDSPNDYCWVWGEYATVTGLAFVLPVFTPPPTPTPTNTPVPEPDFDLGYEGIESCSGFWVNLSMHNTGNVTFESVSLTVTDTATSTVLSVISDQFTENTGCTSVIEKQKAAPGKLVVQSSPKFSYDPHGHSLKATATLCSGSGLNGVCATHTITFTP